MRTTAAMRAAGRAAAVSTILWVAGCSIRSQAPPQVGYERGVVPDFTGARVAVLPVQVIADAIPELDQELAFALDARGEDVVWVFQDELRELVRGNPGTGIQMDGLPVQPFLVGELERVGDPLFGNLYRLGALSNVGWALLPIEVQERADAEEITLELTAALVELRRGYVVWFGIVEGSPGRAGDPFVAATVAEALARRIVR